MARLPYLEADQVAPEYRDMLKRNTNLHKLLVNSPDMARADQQEYPIDQDDEIETVELGELDANEETN